MAGLTFLVTCLGWQMTLAQSFVQASGPKIIDASSQQVILKGVSLGGWQAQEGYMMKPSYGGTQGSIKNYLVEFTVHLC